MLCVGLVLSQTLVSGKPIIFCVILRHYSNTILNLLNCERSELHLHFELKMAKMIKFLKSF